ncbi:hypothetical protein GCM10009836_72680 [Pseudonocardia ailaonensis]|uniref:PASTA domain-containing protein n=1 Tax=Pseudonocardia ailaonensis TaxID=367279 RepID=A0ABN2NPT1_9PSEU
MSDTVVPALVGLSGAEAVTLGADRGVVVVSETEDLVTTGAPVTDQDPKAGFGVEPGSTVTVTIAPGGPPPLVPDPVTAPGPGASHDLPDTDVTAVGTLTRDEDPRDPSI